MSYSYHCVFFFFSHSEFSSGSENCGACDHDIAPVSPRREKNIQWAYAFKEFFLRKKLSDFPSGTAVKNSPPSAGDMDWIPGLEDPTGPEATKPVSHCYAQSPSPQNWENKTSTAMQKHKGVYY